jgi:hypothetical protein
MQGAFYSRLAYTRVYMWKAQVYRAVFQRSGGERWSPTVPVKGKESKGIGMWILEYHIRTVERLTGVFRICGNCLIDHTAEDAIMQIIHTLHRQRGCVAVRDVIMYMYSRNRRCEGNHKDGNKCFDSIRYSMHTSFYQRYPLGTATVC